LKQTNSINKNLYDVTLTIVFAINLLLDVSFVPAAILFVLASGLALGLLPGVFAQRLPFNSNGN